MKSIAIFIKNIKQIKRDSKNLFLIIIFPILIMLIYSTMFSGGLVNLETVNVGVINLDDGDYSNDLLNKIGNISLNSDSKLINLIEIKDESEGNEKIRNEQISALLIIPKNYSNNILNMNINNEVIIKGEPSSIGYMTAISSINLVLLEYSMEIQKRITNQPFKEINLVNQELEDMGTFNTFDFLAPGLIVFSILINITAVTSNIAQETENGMLKRLKLTKMKSSDYIIGTSLSWIIIGSVEIIAVLFTAILCGYHWQGGFNTIIFSIIVGILTIVSSIALSLIIVSITHTQQQASSLAILVSFPLSIICGSFYPLPDFYIGTINGHPMQIYELLPWNQTITIFRELLTYGNSIKSVLPNIFMIIIDGVVLLLISMILFNRKINHTN